MIVLCSLGRNIWAKWAERPSTVPGGNSYSDAFMSEKTEEKPDNRNTATWETKLDRYTESCVCVPTVEA